MWMRKREKARKKASRVAVMRTRGVIIGVVGIVGGVGGGLAMVEDRSEVRLVR